MFVNDGETSLFGVKMQRKIDDMFKRKRQPEHEDEEDEREEAAAELPRRGKLLTELRAN